MADINLNQIPNTWLQDVKVNGTDVRAHSTATNNTIGYIPIEHRITVNDAATGNVDTVLAAKTVVTDVWFVKTGGAGAAGNTIEVRNGTTNAITDALDTNVADKVIVRAGTIDDARWALEAGATLRVVRTKAGGNAAGICFIRGFKVV